MLCMCVCIHIYLIGLDKHIHYTYSSNILSLFPFSSISFSSTSSSERDSQLPTLCFLPCCFCILTPSLVSHFNIFNISWDINISSYFIPYNLEPWNFHPEHCPCFCSTVSLPLAFWALLYFILALISLTDNPNFNFCLGAHLKYWLDLVPWLSELLSGSRSVFCVAGVTAGNWDGTLLSIGLNGLWTVRFFKSGC